MSEVFCLTVGQKYRGHKHPQGLHPDGWCEITADSEEQAHEIAFQNFEGQWAFLYDKKSFNDSFYPLGCIKTISQNHEKQPAR